MSDHFVALRVLGSTGVCPQPRFRRPFDALIIAGLLFCWVAVVALEGHASTIVDNGTYDIGTLTYVPFESLPVMNCANPGTCQGGTQAFQQDVEADIVLPSNLGSQDLLMVFAGFFNNALPNTCDLSDIQQLNASIQPGSVSGAMLVDVFSATGPGTLCDAFGTDLQGLLIPGGSPEDNKRAVDFTVDVEASDPGVLNIGYSLVQYAMPVPEPDTGALLALGLLALSARHRGAQRA